MVSRNVAHKLVMTHATRRIHKMMDSLVHPTFPFMGSYPHSGQAALLFLQRMNPMTAHRPMLLNRAAALSLIAQPTGPTVWQGMGFEWGVPFYCTAGNDCPENGGVRRWHSRYFPYTLGTRGLDVYTP